MTNHHTFLKAGVTLCGWVELVCGYLSENKKDREEEEGGGGESCSLHWNRGFECSNTLVNWISFPFLWSRGPITITNAMMVKGVQWRKHCKDLTQNTEYIHYQAMSTFVTRILAEKCEDPRHTDGVPLSACLHYLHKSCIIFVLSRFYISLIVYLMFLGHTICYISSHCRLLSQSVFYKYLMLTSSLCVIILILGSDATTSI